MKTWKYDGEALSFYDDEKIIAEFLCLPLEDYDWLKSLWTSDKLSYNQLVGIIKAIIRG